MTAPPIVDGRVTFPVWGGEAEVCASPEYLPTAERLVRQVIGLVDVACSTFRPDSDITRVNERAGQWVPVGQTLREILTVTLELAEATDGALDPTVGTVTKRGPVVTTLHMADYRQVRIEGDRVRVPAGMSLDLNSTAKAWCADAAAEAVYQETGCAVLVGLCGDISVAGDGQWPIVCGDDHRSIIPGPHSTLWLSDGAVATSSTTVRRSARGAHVVDPITMRPLTGHWRTASVCAASCVQANAAATAALVKGPNAVAWLESLHLPARLIRGDGDIHTTRGWPL